MYSHSAPGDYETCTALMIEERRFSWESLRSRIQNVKPANDEDGCTRGHTARTTPPHRLVLRLSRPGARSVNTMTEEDSGATTTTTSRSRTHKLIVVPYHYHHAKRKKESGRHPRGHH
eukprot:TRINITY_DN16649_c0_g1_i1.p1 TRINITY_DN16649_c0_g1~~TRINITY_DN16649_c0_g1_i1.p1  ORF type:complete len:118 (+),score=15.24 TRINITY_DN16649_c0_g1_i1:65-418(+)